MAELGVINRESREAGIALLGQQPDAAIKLLPTAVAHHQVWLNDLMDPVYAALYSHPDFATVSDPLLEHLNAERAKLRLPPLPEPDWKNF